MMGGGISSHLGIDEIHVGPEWVSGGHGLAGGLNNCGYPLHIQSSILQLLSCLPNPANC